MGQSWGSHGAAIGHLWGSHGAAMGQPRGSYGAAMGQPWGSHGAAMGQSRGSHGAAMGQPWGRTQQVEGALVVADDDVGLLWGEVVRAPHRHADPIEVLHVLQQRPQDPGGHTALGGARGGGYGGLGRWADP